MKILYSETFQGDPIERVPSETLHNGIIMGMSMTLSLSCVRGRRGGGGGGGWGMVMPE